LSAALTAENQFEWGIILAAYLPLPRFNKQEANFFSLKYKDEPG